MKLLFDQNLSHRFASHLADVFPRSAQVRLLGLDRAPDAEVWEHAAQDGNAIATRNVDLAEMATLRGAPPLVVWPGDGNSSTGAVEAALRARHAGFLDAEESEAPRIKVCW